MTPDESHDLAEALTGETDAEHYAKEALEVLCDVDVSVSKEAYAEIVESLQRKAKPLAE